MIFVAFIGMDGSGKTSVIKNIIKKLHELGIGTVYYHGFFNPILSIIIRNPPKTFTSISYKITEKIETDNKIRVSPLVLTFWHVVVFLETLLFFVYVRLFKSHKKIIIFDRFWLDRYAYLILNNKTNSVIHFLYRVLYPLLIRPDLLVCLIVAPEIAYLRKRKEHPNYTKQFYEKLKDIYNYIYESYNKSDKITLDTSKLSSIDASYIILRKILIKDLNRVLPIIKANRTECIFLKLINSKENNIPKLKVLKNQITTRRTEYIRLLRILSNLTETFGKFIIYKSHNSAIERIPRDLDILVESSKETKVFVDLLLNRLKKQYGANPRCYTQWDKSWEMQIILSNYKVEVSSEIRWFGYTFLSNKIIFNNTKSKFLDEYKVKIPNNPIDFLLRCIHSIFGDFYLRYDEFKHLIYLYFKMKKKDFIFMQSLAKNNGWEDAYHYLIKLIKNIERKSTKIENIRHGFEIPTFPVYIPYPLVIYFIIKMLIYNLKNRKLKIEEAFIIFGQFLIHFVKNLFYRIIDIFFYTKTYRDSV